MSKRDTYQPGVPCWIETLQPDPDAARRFYEGVFGWEFTGPGGMPGDPPARYFVARMSGRDVAGVGSQVAEAAPSAWTTYVMTDDVAASCERAAAAGGAIVAGPIEAPPAGTLAVLSDPAGAVFGVWQPEVRHGAQVVNEPSAWAMSALHTPDPDGANRFYSELFGWEPETFSMGPAEITLWRLPGYVGGEPGQPVPRDVVAAMMPGATAQWSVDFWIDDADAAAGRAPALGGRVVAPAEDRPGFRTAVLADPGGAVFSVSKLEAH
jgi:predicted enzyme related to lactoylglutathione lyase